jgi:ribulose-bisphosphate carboxylase small chain
MRATKGSFPFLPDLTDEQIRRQVTYALGQGWAISIEHADDPSSRNVTWEMWGVPMFDARDAARVMRQVDACRAAKPDRYVKVVAFDATRGWETVRLSFLVQRPSVEPTFELLREECDGHRVRYTLRPRRPAERRAP